MVSGRETGGSGCPGPSRRGCFLGPFGDFPVLQTHSPGADHLHRTVKPFFHDHLPGQNRFGDLIELAVVGDGVVVSNGAVGLETQVSIQLEPRLGFDMDIGLDCRSYPEAAVEGGEILPEKGVGRLPGGDISKPHFLDQPILQCPE